jgi:hypothetical protein
MLLGRRTWSNSRVTQMASDECRRLLAGSLGELAATAIPRRPSSSALPSAGVPPAARCSPRLHGGRRGCPRSPRLPEVAECKVVISALRSRSPEPRTTSPAPGSRSPEVRATSPVVGSRLSLERKRSPDASRRFPWERKRSPGASRRLRLVRKRSPIVGSTSPGVRSTSPIVRLRLHFPRIGAWRGSQRWWRKLKVWNRACKQADQRPARK